MVALGGAWVFMPCRVLHLMELRAVLQGESDKAGTQAMRGQLLQFNASRISLHLRLDCLIAHGSARRVIAAAETHKERVARRHDMLLLERTHRYSTRLLMQIRVQRCYLLLKALRMRRCNASM